MSEPKDDPKDRFREALERKRSKKHPHEGASQNSSKVQDAHAAAGGKRNFRRKSG
jgi:hypothetical protein